MRAAGAEPGSKGRPSEDSADTPLAHPTWSWPPSHPAHTWEPKTLQPSPLLSPFLSRSQGWSREQRPAGQAHAVLSPSLMTLQGPSCLLLHILHLNAVPALVPPVGSLQQPVLARVSIPTLTPVPVPTPVPILVPTLVPIPIPILGQTRSQVLGVRAMAPMCTVPQHQSGTFVGRCHWWRDPLPSFSSKDPPTSSCSVSPTPRIPTGHPQGQSSQAPSPPHLHPLSS